MPETRFIEHYKNSLLVSKEPYEVSDEQLADEKEAQEIEKLKDMLSQIWTASQTQDILKKLLVRLYKKGIIP